MRTIQKISTEKEVHAALKKITSVPSLLFTKKGRVTVKVEYSGLYEYFRRGARQPQNRP